MAAAAARRLIVDGDLAGPPHPRRRRHVPRRGHVRPGRLEGGPPPSPGSFGEEGSRPPVASSTACRGYPGWPQPARGKLQRVVEVHHPAQGGIVQPDQCPAATVVRRKSSGQALATEADQPFRDRGHLDASNVESAVDLRVVVASSPAGPGLNSAPPGTRRRRRGPRGRGESTSGVGAGLVRLDRRQDLGDAPVAEQVAGPGVSEMRVQAFEPLQGRLKAVPTGQPLERELEGVDRSTVA